MDKFTAEYKRANAIIDDTKKILDFIQNHKKFNEKLIPVSINYNSIKTKITIDEAIELLLTKKTIQYRD